MSDDAKVLTTAEAECLPEHGDEDGGMPGVVLVDRDDLLATTRALEKIEEGVKLWHGTPPDERAMLAINKAGEMWRSAVAERDSAIARAEKAERELAEISHQTVDGSVVAKMSRKSLERFAVRLHQERNTAERERDACAAELANRYDAKQAFANAEAERDAARTRVSELETALEAIVCHWGASDEGQVHPDLIAAARAALAKAKGAANG